MRSKTFYYFLFVIFWSCQGNVSSTFSIAREESILISETSNKFIRSLPRNLQFGPDGLLWFINDESEIMAISPLDGQIYCSYNLDKFYEQFGGNLIPPWDIKEMPSDLFDDVAPYIGNLKKVALKGMDIVNGDLVVLAYVLSPYKSKEGLVTASYRPVLVTLTKMGEIKKAIPFNLKLPRNTQFINPRAFKVDANSDIFYVQTSYRDYRRNEQVCLTKMKMENNIYSYDTFYCFPFPYAAWYDLKSAETDIAHGPNKAVYGNLVKSNGRIIYSNWEYLFNLQNQEIIYKPDTTLDSIELIQSFDIYSDSNNNSITVILKTVMDSAKKFENPNYYLTIVKVNNLRSSGTGIYINERVSGITAMDDNVYMLRQSQDHIYLDRYRVLNH